jgi:rod shape determining protein RodA
MFKQYQLKNYRIRLVTYVIILSFIGIAVIGSAKQSVQSKQIFGLAVGIIAMLIVSLIDYSFILKFSWLLYFLNIALLLSIFVMGQETNGSTRWINIAGIRFQPSELSKILIIIFFAYFFMKHQERLNTIGVLAATIVLIGIPLVLIKKQPALSTTIVTAFIFIALLFIAGLSYKIIIGVLGISIPAALIFISLVLQENSHLIDPYQKNRIMAWLEPSKYTDSSYQQLNSIMAFGSGQLWGKGLNNTNIDSVKNGNFISESQTDFIFAVAGEELGFVGALIIILLLLLITLECILIARKAKDLSGKLICCGVATMISFQGFVNICVVTGLMPNTGLPLPFVSYGLTSLVSCFIGIGLVLNVGLQPKKYG